METILLKFDGYWLERYVDELPHEAGVYCVYACEPMGVDKIVVLRELIYIGSAEDVATCLADHASIDVWKLRLRNGEVLCYSFAPVAGDAVDMVRGGLVAHHMPPCNRVEKDVLPCAEVSVSIAGEHIFLDDSVMIGTDK